MSLFRGDRRYATGSQPREAQNSCEFSHDKSGNDTQGDGTGCRGAQQVGRKSTPAFDSANSGKTTNVTQGWVRRSARSNGDSVPRDSDGSGIASGLHGNGLQFEKFDRRRKAGRTVFENWQASAAACEAVFSYQAHFPACRTRKSVGNQVPQRTSCKVLIHGIGSGMYL